MTPAPPASPGIVAAGRAERVHAVAGAVRIVVAAVFAGVFETLLVVHVSSLEPGAGALAGVRLGAVAVGVALVVLVAAAWGAPGTRSAAAAARVEGLGWGVLAAQLFVVAGALGGTSVGDAYFTLAIALLPATALLAWATFLWRERRRPGDRVVGTCLWCGRLLVAGRFAEHAACGTDGAPPSPGVRVGALALRKAATKRRAAPPCQWCGRRLDADHLGEHLECGRRGEPAGVAPPHLRRY